jgi:hypothetical protein
MSMNLASFYRRTRRTLSRPFGFVRRHLPGGPAPIVASRENAGSSANEPMPRDDADHLERIATYARAGYFNMGYTLDVFHVSD